MASSFIDSDNQNTHHGLAVDENTENEIFMKADHRFTQDDEDPKLSRSNAGRPKTYAWRKCMKFMDANNQKKCANYGKRISNATRKCHVCGGTSWRYQLAFCNKCQSIHKPHPTQCKLYVPETPQRKPFQPSLQPSLQIYINQLSKQIQEKKVQEMSLQELSRYFNMSLTQASSKLHCTPLELQQRCRQLGIVWPAPSNQQQKMYMYHPYKIQKPIPKKGFTEKSPTNESPTKPNGRYTDSPDYTTQELAEFMKGLNGEPRAFVKTTKTFVIQREGKSVFETKQQAEGKPQTSSGIPFRIEDMHSDD